jgi:superfamily II RNA helicase
MTGVRAEVVELGAAADAAPETYRGYRLDPFQRQAIAAIAAGRSVLVSAPTGTGKTLIADYLVERAAQAGQRVVYTAPIKALSNQKFDDYCAMCGEEHVGLLTGDVSIRPDAPLVIMTTEVLRNQLITGDERLENLAWVVFDEIHYISTDRGIAWEESIILLPKGTRILGLSATISNLDTLADWIEETTGAPVERVRETRRAVPLLVRYVTPEGVCNYREARRWSEEHGEAQQGRLGHLDLVRVLQREDALPALYFVFSRLGTEERAREAAEHWQLLDARQQREMARALDEAIARYPGARELRGELGRCLLRGIGYHHAGLLPATKRAVEHLYARGLIRLLYCTETFAVGVNYPVRAVALESSRKFDGTQFRPLTVQEFQQMTGRAGRRGKDKRGLAFIGVDGRDRIPLPNYPGLPLEPLRSQFFVTESTALNLLRTFGRERALDVLSRNFREYQRRLEEARERGHLEELLLERQQLQARGCPHLGTAACPLERQRLLQLQAEYRRKRRRRTGRARQAVDRVLMELQAQLATPEDCPRPSPEPCRPLLGPFRRLQERLAAAERSLQDVSVRNHYREEMDRVCALLERLGYIEGERLLPRGEVARHLHVEPLLLTELLFDGFFHRESEETIGAILAAVDYDARHDDACFGLRKVAAVREVEKVVRRLRDQGAQVHFDPVVCPLVYAWAQGEPFSLLIKHTTIQDGDFIGAVRRALDLLRQLRVAAREDQALVDKLARVSARLDRDEAQVLF